MQSDNFPSPFIVTIDGPSGVGKTTIAKMLADHLGFQHLVGGTFLRSFTSFILDNHINSNDEELVSLQLTKFKLTTIPQTNHNAYRIIANGLDVTDTLWTARIDAAVSRISTYPEVRKKRKEWLRGFAENKRIVADGRTLGSEIFPEANVKFYLDAKNTVRALRRADDHARVEQQTSESTLQLIEKRDELDRTTGFNRLTIQNDQIYLDTSEMSIQEVFDTVTKRVSTHGNSSY